MNKETAILIAGDFFPNYPTVDEFHITSDGWAFADRESATAKAHAETLKDKGLIRVNREDCKNSNTPEQTNLTTGPELEDAKANVGAVASNQEAGKVDDTNQGEITPEQKLENAKTKLADATTKLADKQQALAEATPQQKGSRTIAVKKAEDELEKAKEALAALTAEQ